MTITYFGRVLPNTDVEVSRQLNHTKIRSLIREFERLDATPIIFGNPHDAQDPWRKLARDVGLDETRARLFCYGPGDRDSVHASVVAVYLRNLLVYGIPDWHRAMREDMQQRMGLVFEGEMSSVSAH